MTVRTSTPGDLDPIEKASRDELRALQLQRLQWSATQAVHNTRGWIAAPLGVEPDAVRVVVPDMGGGFGGKLGNYPEDVMVAWLARRLGRPMRWVESRREHMANFSHARA